MNHSESQSSNAQLAATLIDWVGGNANIKSVEHCATRLRFKLHDPAKIQRESIESHPRVIIALESIGQYQIVLGEDVDVVYGEIIQQREQTSHPLTRLFDDSISDPLSHAISLTTMAFKPLIVLLLATGLLRVGVDLAYHWQFIAQGSYRLLHTAASASYYFLPILLAHYAAKAFKVPPYLMMITAASLFHPDIHSGLFTQGQMSSIPWIVAPWPLPKFDYASSVIPILFLCWGTAQLQHRIAPKVSTRIRYFLVPLLGLIFFTCFAYLVMTPLLQAFTDLWSESLAYLNIHARLLAGALAGGFGQFFTRGSIMQLVNDPQIALLLLPTLIGQAGAALGIALKTPELADRIKALLAAFLALCGLPVVAIFGFNLPKLRPFLWGVFAAAIGGAILSLIPQQLPLRPPESSLPLLMLRQPTEQLLIALLGAVVTLLLAMTGSYFSYPKLKPIEPRREPETERASNQTPRPQGKACSQLLASPLSGEIIDQQDIADSMFSESIIGEGVGVIPAGEAIYAPFNGRVLRVFQGNHAISVQSDDGIEMLIHIGLKTVRNRGDNFQCSVSEGETIKTGQSLLQFDRSQLQAKGFDLTTPVLITNAESYQRIDRNQHHYIDHGQPLLVLTND